MGAERFLLRAAGASALILSPALSAPPIGADALRVFLRSWEIVP
jgi:hypothetical protein